MHIEYEKYKLKNGLEVLLIPSDTTYSVTVKALVKAGSAYENENNQGMSHFVEHLSLQATKKWPDKEKFIQTIEYNGASYNGNTGKESVSYYINIPYTKLEFGIDFINQVLYHALFDPNHIEKERTIIIDEISKQEDDVYYSNFTFIKKLLSTRNSSYTLDIAGTKEKVMSYTGQELYDHYVQIHNPKKVLLVLVGNFSPDHAKALINRYFEDIPSNYKEKSIPEDGIKTKLIKTKPDKKTDLVLSSIVFPGPPNRELDTKQGFLLDFMIKFLAGTGSSRLYKRLRTQEGLLYHISSNTLIYESFGSIYVDFDVTPENFEKAINLIIEEIDRFAQDGISEEELLHLQEYVTNRNLVYYDNIHSYSKLITGPTFLGGEILLLEQLNNYTKSLSIEDINQEIRKYYKLSKANFIYYGNVKKELESITQKKLETVYQNN